MSTDAPAPHNPVTLHPFLIGPPLVLMLVALFAWNVVDWLYLLLAGGLAGVALGLAVLLLLHGRVALDIALLVLLLGGSAGIGLAIIANCALDRDPGLQQASTVIEKFETRGRRGSRHYHLTLAPWGPVKTAESVRVNGNAYDLTKVGDRACVRLHRGAMGGRWYEYAWCSGNW